MCKRSIVALVICSSLLSACFGAGSASDGQVLSGSRLFTLDTLEASLQAAGSRVVRGQSYCCGAPFIGGSMQGEAATTIFVDDRKLIVVIYRTPQAARRAADTLPAIVLPTIDGQPAAMHVSGNALVLYAGADMALARQVRGSVRMI